MNYAVQQLYPKSRLWRTFLRTTSRKSAVKRARKVARTHPSMTVRVVKL